MQNDELSRMILRAVEEAFDRFDSSKSLDFTPKQVQPIVPTQPSYVEWVMNGWKWKFAFPRGTVDDPLQDEAFPHVVEEYSSTLVLGGRGSGKTALGFRMLELYRDHRSDTYIVGAPRSAMALLPRWIKHVDSIFTLPDNSVALIDEAHLNLGPHISEADRKELASMLALTRQRRQTLFIISQQARTISREIVAAVDILIIKSLRQNQVRFDRPEFTEAMELADQALSTVLGVRKPYAFVYSPEDRLGHLMKSELPGFWNESLSRMYADASPIKTLKDEADEKRRRLIARARELHRQGFSYGAIAKRLGISKGTAWNYVNLGG